MDEATMDGRRTYRKAGRAVRGAGVLAAAVLLTAAVAASAGSQQPSRPESQTGARPQAGMMEKCQAMMAEHEQMMKQLGEADQRLDALVSKMNAATGPEKTDAVAAVVSEMVSQRKAMRERMMAMQHRMMAHMGEHMQAGPGSMAGCPMMKDMKKPMM